MNNDARLTTEEKALKINLTPDIYGCFAEIGAGQEVAANFFKAGGSSGTIAYTQSAYDMKVSDSMYGPASRYVCEDRLITMLGTEYQTLKYRLPEKYKSSRFFAFSNTVESLNYHRTNQGQGWVGIRFQRSLGEEPSDVVLHVNMHDNNNKSQQAALGILGVNLIYACYFQAGNMDDFFTGLMSRLPRERMEIDMMRVSGPAFEGIDNRIIARGENLSVVFELTLKDLTADGKISDKDFIDRAELLGSLGYTVMISNYLKHYKMIDYLATIAKEQLMGVILGVYNVHSIFDERYYDNLRGGLLEAFGRGFGHNVKLFVYPANDVETGDLYSLDNIEINPKFKGLLEYLKDANKIEAIHGFDSKLLHIWSDDVLSKIKTGSSIWEEDVPEEVVKAIKFFELFGYVKKEETISC
jgi:hypothetical protein